MEIFEFADVENSTRNVAGHYEILNDGLQRLKRFKIY